MALRFDEIPAGSIEEGPVATLVTPGFHPLADFASFGASEAESVIDTAGALATWTDGLARSAGSYLKSRPESADLLAGVDLPVDEARMKHWMAISQTPPYDSGTADALRGLCHMEGGRSTFPGLNVALPPQMILGLMAWIQGEMLRVLSETANTGTLSSAGGAWMNLMMLQLNIMLEPYLIEPTGPLGHHGAASYHSLADFAGFGPKQRKVMSKTGPLIEAAAGGVIALAYTYLLSRPESKGYFQDEPHLAQRKKTLKAWWIKTATQPKDGEFHDYMSKVADAHVPGGGTHPHVVIPADLTIALMGWVEMRVMTALNTIAQDDEDEYVFGVMGEPAVTAEVGAAWMRMLTLQLGILMGPYLSDASFSR